MTSPQVGRAPSGGSVELALGADENGAFARVDDTGVGIDDTDLPRVFDVAYRGSNGRVHGSDPALPSGSGLGGPGAGPSRHAVGPQSRHQGTVRGQAAAGG